MGFKLGYRGKAFFIVLGAFLVLGIPFKVMVLIEGFTEVRPVNAIPPVAGLICGPIGALACGIGNVIADLFGTFSVSSVLGFFGNMLAAYLPYRMWHIYSQEEPNFHKNKNIGIYIFICLSAAVTVGWILGFGLYYFFGQWIESIYTYVIYNNVGFSVGLGLPLFIMLSSDQVKVPCVSGPRRFLLLKNQKLRKILPVIYTIIMAAVFVGVAVFHCTPETDGWLHIFSAVGLVGLVMILL